MATETRTGNELIANERKCSVVFERHGDAPSCDQCGRQFTSAKYLEMHRTAMHLRADDVTRISAQHLLPTQTRNDVACRHLAREVGYRGISSFGRGSGFRSANPCRCFPTKIGCADAIVEMKRFGSKAVAEYDSKSVSEVDRRIQGTIVKPICVKTDIEHLEPASTSDSGHGMAKESIDERNVISPSNSPPQQPLTTTTSSDCPATIGPSSVFQSCPVCKKHLSHKSSLRNHQRTHTGQRPYICEICSIGFKERYHLKKHALYKHSDEKTEQCLQCGKHFKDSTAVRAHLRIHSDRRPFSCPRCAKSFKTSECLWHHAHRSRPCDVIVKPANQATKSERSSVRSRPQLCRVEAKATEVKSSLNGSKKSSSTAGLHDGLLPLAACSAAKNQNEARPLNAETVSFLTSTQHQLRKHDEKEAVGWSIVEPSVLSLNATRLSQTFYISDRPPTLLSTTSIRPPNRRVDSSTSHQYFRYAGSRSPLISDRSLSTKTERPEITGSRSGEKTKPLSTHLNGFKGSDTAVSSAEPVQDYSEMHSFPDRFDSRIPLIASRAQSLSTAATVSTSGFQRIPTAVVTPMKRADQDATKSCSAIMTSQRTSRSIGRLVSAVGLLVPQTGVTLASGHTRQLSSAVNTAHLPPFETFRALQASSTVLS